MPAPTPDRPVPTTGPPLPVRWVWCFLDTPQPDADVSWAFWAAVTRGVLSPRRGASGEFATLLPRRGAAWVKVQRVGAGGGIHLDLDVPDVAAAAPVAEALGARRIGAIGDTVVILRSPGGFVFCLTTWRGEGGWERGTGPQVRIGEPDLLDQVCLDIPADRYAAECAFWAALTGWEAGRYDETFGVLTPPSGIPVRLLLQRTGDTANVRGHVDFACADRHTSVARHVALGATVEAQHEEWTVLVDPVGRRYCLTHRPVDQRAY